MPDFEITKPGKKFNKELIGKTKVNKAEKIQEIKGKAQIAAENVIQDVKSNDTNNVQIAQGATLDVEQFDPDKIGKKNDNKNTIVEVAPKQEQEPAPVKVPEQETKAEEKPVAEKATEPVTKAEAKPVAEKATEPVTKAEAKPVAEKAPEPVTATKPELDMEIVSEPKTEAPATVRAATRGDAPVQDAPVQDAPAQDTPSTVNNNGYKGVQETFAQLNNSKLSEEEKAEIRNNITRATGLIDETEKFGNYTLIPIKDDEGLKIGYSYTDKNGKAGEINMMGYDRLTRAENSEDMDKAVNIFGGKEGSVIASHTETVMDKIEDFVENNIIAKISDSIDKIGDSIDKGWTQVTHLKDEEGNDTLLGKINTFLFGEEDHKHVLGYVRDFVVDSWELIAENVGKEDTLNGKINALLQSLNTIVGGEEGNRNFAGKIIDGVGNFFTQITRTKDKDGNETFLGKLNTAIGGEEGNRNIIGKGIDFLGKLWTHATRLTDKDGNTTFLGSLAKLAFGTKEKPTLLGKLFGYGYKDGATRINKETGNAEIFDKANKQWVVVNTEPKDGEVVDDGYGNIAVYDAKTNAWIIQEDNNINNNEEDPFVPVGVDLNGNEIINAENEDGLHNWENDELTNNMTQEEKMDFYNSLLNKDLSDEEIKQALAEAGIDYEKDIKTYEGDYNHNATEYEIVHNKQSKEDVFYEKQNINGQEVTTATIFRDANGNITQEERVEYDANGKRIGSTNYLYDANGRVLQNSETKFDENGKIVSISDCRTTYDKEGKIASSVSIEAKYKDGQLSAENKIEYDKDGNIKTRTTTSNNYDKKGNLISSLVSEYEGDGIAPSAIYITNRDKQGNLITDKIDPKSGKKIAKSMVDPSGNTYNYKADAGTDSGFELTSVTNKNNETFVIKDYMNNDGILDWKKLQQDGWGTSLTGDSAQKAFADLLNGASVDEIIAKYETNTENHAAQKISNNGNNSHYNNPTGYVNYTGNSFYDAGANGWAVGQTGSGLVWQDGNTDSNHFNNWTIAPGMTGSMSQFMEGFMRGRGGGSAGAHY